MSRDTDSAEGFPDVAHITIGADGNAKVVEDGDIDGVGLVGEYHFGGAGHLTLTRKFALDDASVADGVGYA